MRTFFVVNPASANGTTGKLWVKLAATIARSLRDFGVAFTRGPNDAVEMTRKALEAKYECIVAVGGDGTINEVANGFLRDGVVINPAAALGLLPRGTGGDFRRNFDWHYNFEAAVERLKTPETRPLDVGLVTFRGHDGQMVHRYFVNVASFGISGMVAGTVNSTTKILGGRASFAIASLKALSTYRDRTVQLTIDSAPAETLSVTSVAIANGKYFGGGMKVAPDADLSDGKFDVTIWSGYGLSDFIFRNRGVYSGAHITWSGTRNLRATSVRATSDDHVLIDVDGEQLGTLPIEARIIPGALRLKA